MIVHVSKTNIGAQSCQGVLTSRLCITSLALPVELCVTAVPPATPLGLT